MDPTGSLRKLSTINDVPIQPVARKDVLFEANDGVNNIFSRICDCVQDAYYYLVEWLCSCFLSDDAPTNTLIVKGNILDQKVEAIVNAANEKCLGGGGIDGAIHRAAGPGLLNECKKLPIQTKKILPSSKKGKKPTVIEIRCPIGTAVMTGSHNLSKKGIQHIIHTAGPIYNSQKPDLMKQQLASAYESSLRLARNNGIKSVALPLISAGIYGYPVDEATQIAVKTIQTFCARHPGCFDTVKLVELNSAKFHKMLKAANEMIQLPQGIDTAALDAAASENDVEQSED